ncbi:MAG: TerD family protein [Candidatus Competibacteraceae bacterium]|nr:TerD family protein [Candidatus Competibacteraceae bacterium]
MAILLQKGESLTLKSDKQTELAQIRVHLCWAERVSEGMDFDLDASAFLLDENDRVRFDQDLVFYHQLRSLCRAVEHLGDNRVGGGDGETIRVDLHKLPIEIQKVVFTVTIHEGDERGQHFGLVDSASISLIDDADNGEIVRFNLSTQSRGVTAVVFAELYRDVAAWGFRAMGEGSDGGLTALCHRYGLETR